MSQKVQSCQNQMAQASHSLHTIQKGFTFGLEYELALMFVVEAYKGDKSSYAHLVKISIYKKYT